MNYKIYKNEEVKNWTNAPKEFTSVKQLKESFDKNHKALECLMPFDYIENTSNTEIEWDIRRVLITDIQGYFESDMYDNSDYVNIVFSVSKRLPEMKNRYDLYSNKFIKPFKDIKLFDIESIDLKWRLVMAINPPMFMQQLDNRIIIKPDNLQPQWWQEWKKSDSDYDFSKNTYTQKKNIFNYGSDKI